MQKAGGRLSWSRDAGCSDVLVEVGDDLVDGCHPVDLCCEVLVVVGKGGLDAQHGYDGRRQQLPWCLIVLSWNRR